MASTAKRDLIRRLIKGIDIAMFTTFGEGGFPVSRPLSTQQVEFDGKVLWFFVRKDSPKVAEIGRHPRVNVAYASKETNAYLSVAGTADIVDDQKKIDELWNDALKVYFAKGRTDPNLVLVRVTVHTVQYWDGPSTGLGKVIAFVIAAVTSDDTPLGENRLLRMEEAPPKQRRAARRKAVIAAKTARTGAPRKAAKKAVKKAAKKAAPRKSAKKVARPKKASR
jgi:general stress protein 26